MTANKREAMDSNCIPMGGLQWWTEVTIIIWMYILNALKSHNGDNHGRTAEEQEKHAQHKLLPSIQVIYWLHDQILPAANQYLYHIPMSELTQQSVGQLQWWLHLAQPYTKQQLQAYKMQRAEGTQDICQFFQVIQNKLPAHDNTTQWPP